MREMKNSGIEWIGEIPVDWNLKKLKLLFAISSGSTPKSDNLEYWDGTIPWITPADYKTEEKYVYYGRKFLSEKGLNAANLQLIPINSIIFSKRAPIGAVAITGTKLAINQGCISCVPIIECDVRYYYYALSIYTEQFNLLGSGTTFKEISSKDFGDFILPAPGLLFQEKLAAYFDRKCDKIDDIIARQQEVVEKLKAYKLSVISEAVTKGLDPNVPMKDSGVEWIGEIPEHWEFRKIKNCCDIVDCKNRTPEMIPDGDYIVVRTTCIKDGTFSYDGSYRTDKKNFEEWTVKGRPQHGDIFFTREAPMGEACLVPDDNNLCMGQRVMFFRPTHGEDPRFILYSIYGPLAREYIESKNKGSTVGHLKLGQVASLPLLYCAPEEQKKIANYLDEKCKAINELISCKQEVVGKLQQYKKSLIYEVVTGKKEV